MQSIERARERLLAANPELISDGEPGASDATLASYANRGRLLVRRFKREMGLPQELDDFDPRDFADWMLSRKTELKSSTWRTYRQGALYVIEAMPHPEVDEAIRRLNSDGDQDRRQEKPILSRDRKTSTLKEKRFPKEDFERILHYLTYISRSQRAPELHDWLVASIHTGLRPIEWRATAMEDQGEGRDRKVWLHIINAKATNGRGNGLSRTLDISSYTPEVLHAIRNMSERGLSWYEQGTFNEVKAHVSQILYNAFREIFPNREMTYSLYSCRHQFIANMKSLHPLEEVSAMVGHGTDVTAAERYGKRRFAWPPDDIQDRPQAMPDEVASVRQQMRFAEERRRIREMIGLPNPAPGGELL